MIGRVVSAKSLKTATVIVERVAMHPLYKKTYMQSKKYLVDDSKGVKVGDIVEFVKCRPISKRKNWMVTKVLGKTFAEIAEGMLKEDAQKVIAEVMPEEKVKEDLVSKQVDSSIPVVNEKEEKQKSKKKKGK